MNESIQLLIYNTIIDLVEKICPGECLKEDLIHHIFLVMVEKPPILIDELIQQDRLRFYISKVITNNIKSKTSPFYIKYKKFSNITSDINETEYRIVTMEE